MILLIATIAIGIPAFSLYKEAKAVIASGRNLQKAVVVDQDISKIKAGIGDTRTKLNDMKSTYKWLSWMKVVPVVRQYYLDGQAFIGAGEHGLNTADLVVAAIEPYADIIGFTAESHDNANSAEENANDRIEFIVATIDELLPKMDGIISEAKLTQSELSRVDPGRYPKTLKGREIRSNLQKGLSMADEGFSFLEKCEFSL